MKVLEIVCIALALSALLIASKVLGLIAVFIGVFLLIADPRFQTNGGRNE